MKAFEKKVTQLASRHGWQIRKLERASIPCYIVTAESYEDFCKITAALNRCKTLHYQIIYSSSGFHHIVEIFDAVQWNAWQTFERQKTALVDVFYGKKAYHDMSKAEQKIVDSYEGEASYADTLARHLIPTKATLLQLNA